jgi:mannose-1-phosphate guanylyltransferase
MMTSAAMPEESPAIPEEAPATAEALPAGVQTAMIVAGGAGTRMHPLTLTTPKPLLPFCGAPFLQGLIARLAADGIRRVVLVVGADPAPYDRVVTTSRALGVDVSCVDESTPLDTAGGVRAALDQVDGTFLVLNGDVLSDLDFRALANAHVNAGADATLALTRVLDTSAFGVCVLDGARIVGFVEKPKPGELVGHDTVNAGAYVLEPAALERFPLGALSFERTVFPTLVADGALVHGVVTQGVWTDLGTPERFLAGHRMALDGALDWPTLHHRTRLSDRDALVGRDVHLADDVQICGPVVLGDGVTITGPATIGPHVVVGDGSTIAGADLSDVVVFDDAMIASSLSNTIVGNRVHVASGAQIGAGTMLGDDVAVAAGDVIAPGARLSAW